MSLVGSPVFRGEREINEDVQQEERVPQQSGSLTMTVSFRCAVSVTHAGIGRDNVHYICTLNVCLWTTTHRMYFLFSAMVIGFEIRNQTVSERQAPSGMDRFPIRINITSERTSDLDYYVPLRYVDNVGEAILEGFQSTTLEFDALFGYGDPPEVEQVLFAGSQQLQETSFIINEFLAEDRECFSLRVVVLDAGPGVRTNFRCNEDGAGDAFFCLHTICILDDDG